MKNLSINSKLPAVETSIFTVMSALAAQHNAVNLSQGFPDFEVDPALIKLVNKAMKAGHNQYSPSAGQIALRQQISNLIAQVHGVNYNPETEITVTSGATEALFAAISAIVENEDEVLIFEPAYDSYVPAIHLNGGHAVFVQLDYPEYTIDWESVKKKISLRTKLIILNSPHNPTGTMLSEDDLHELTKIIRDKEIFIIADEVYEHIIFDGRTHYSLGKFPELAARTFVISSFGKTFHATGWKVGYCAAPQRLTQEFRKVHQFLTFSTATPFQVALAEYLADLEKVTRLGAFYQEKRDRFLELIKPSRFEPLPCHGTYFQLLSYKNISDEKDVDFARRLTIEHGIASIPVSVFYHGREDNNVLRFCFAKSEETLQKAAEILNSL